MIPGGNIYKMATRLIATSAFTYYKFLSRQETENGYDLATYASGRCAKGSIQPISRNMYEHMGLDLQRTYYNFFVPMDIIDINRDVSADQMEFNCQRFQCLSNTPWFGIDGWSQVLCVKVPDAG